MHAKGLALSDWHAWISSRKTLARSEHKAAWRSDGMGSIQGLSALGKPSEEAFRAIYSANIAESACFRLVYWLAFWKRSASAARLQAVSSR